MFNSSFLKNKLEIGYPAEKRLMELGMPWILVQRVISIPLVIVCVLLKVPPNIISCLSILLFIFGSYVILNGFLFMGLSFGALAMILDCVDGEVARISGKTSVLGEKLEQLNADLFLLVGIPSVSVWLFLYNNFSILILYFCFLSASIYILNRGALNFNHDFPMDKLSLFKKIIMSQSKSSIKIRNESFLGNLIFYLRINLATQDGIIILIILFIAILMPPMIFYPVVIMSLMQLIIGVFIIMANLLNKKV